MSKEQKHILNCTHREKSIKISFDIYADIEPLLEKIDPRQNYPKKPSTTKVKKHTMCDYSLFTHCSFDSNKNKCDYYKGID